VRPLPVPADPSWPEDLLAPSYRLWLGSVLPAVAASLSAEPAGAAPEPDHEVTGLVLPVAQRAVVALVDGLGAEQLRRRGGHAPFLRGLDSPLPDLACGYPSTTASSTAGLTTGLAPGQHGLVGWQTLMPGTDRLLNHLSWDGGPDPHQWQPHPTLFQGLEQAGVAVTHVAPATFERSGLTRAALRGGSFAAADAVADRVGAVLAALRRPGRALVYVYFGEVDKAGHVHGPDSWQWSDQVEAVDAALAEIAAGMPPGTSLTVTADHGMVAAPEQERLDLAWHPELAHGIRHLGGEPRAPQPYCEPGAADEVLQAWRSVLGHRAVVLSRVEAVAAGWFGPVGEAVLPRIGDLVVAMRGGATVLDSRALRPQVLALRGHHGSLTREEMLVPLLHRPA
jgi:Type I phosphodiesterase / nucleotide pyrophosphatase